MADRVYTTKWEFEVGSGAAAVKELFSIFKELKGFVDQDLLRQALNTEGADARLVAINKLIEDAIQKEKQWAKERGVSVEKPIQKTDELKTKISQYLAKAAQISKAGHFDQLASKISTANTAMGRLAVLLQGPIKAGTATVDQLRETLRHLADTTGRLADAPLLSPESARNIEAVGVAARSVLETMDRIDQKTASISSKNFFKGKGALTVDAAGADKLVRMFEKTSGYWEKNERKVEETYRKALDGEEKAQRQLIDRTRKMNGLVEAAERFRDAAKKGVIPESYGARMEKMLETLLSSDSILGRVRVGAQNMMKELGDPAAENNLQRVLQITQEITAELSSAKMSEGADDYQKRLTEAFTRVRAKINEQSGETRKFWEQTRDHIASWKQAYTNAIDEINVKRKAMEAGTADQHQIERVIGRDEVKVADEYLRVLFRQKKNLKDMIKSSEEYAAALRKQAGSSKEAKIELEKTEGILRQMKGTLGVVNSEISQVGKRSQESFANMEKGAAGAARTFRGLNQDVKNFGYFMDIAIQKIIRYRVAFTVLHEIVRFFKSTLDVPKQLEHQFAQLRKVMDETTTDFKTLKNSAIGFAIDYGTSIKDVSDVMFVWAQQGKNQVEILELTQTALLGVTAANLTAKQATEALTAAIKQFDIAAEDSAIIIDKLLNVQRNFAVTAQDLADSIKLLGATAQILGLDINELFGQVTAVAEITRKSGKAVANSLKTIFARIVKKDAINALQAVGIALYDMEGNLRPLGDVLADISSKWSTLTKAEQIHIAHVVGGIRRYNDFLVLMKNYGASLRATAISLDSQGAAADAAKIEMDTLHRAVESAKAGFQKFTEAVGRNRVGFAQLGYAYKGLMTALVNDKGELTALGKTFSNLTAGVGSLLLTLITAKSVAFTAGLAFRNLMKATYANVIASAEMTTENKAFTAEQIRAAIATELNTKQQMQLYRALSLGQGATVQFSKGLVNFQGVQKGVAASTGVITGIVDASGKAMTGAAISAGFWRTALLGVGTALKGIWAAIGPVGVILGLVSVGLTALLIKRGKDAQALEAHTDAAHQNLQENAKLLEVFQKSQKALKAHTNQLVHMATALRSGAALPIDQLEQFDKFLLQINQHLAVFGEEPIAPHVWTDDQVANVTQMEEAIGKVLAKMENIDEKTYKFSEQVLANLQTTIGLEEQRQAFLRAYLADMGDVNEASSKLVNATQQTVANVAQLGDSDLTKGTIRSMAEIFDRIASGEEWSDSWLNGLRKVVRGTAAEGIISDWGALLTTFASKYAESAGKVANSKFKDEFSDDLETTYKERGKTLVDFLRDIAEEAKKYQLVPEIIPPTDIEDTSKSLERQMRVQSDVIESNRKVTNSINGMADAMEDSSTGQLTFINLLNALGIEFDQSRERTKDLTAELLAGADAYGVIAFSTVDFKKQVTESISAMAKARTMIRGYVGSVEEQNDVRYDALKLDLEYNTTLGKLTSAYEVHRRGLEKSVKTAYDAFILQKAKLVEYKNELAVSDDVSKANLAMHKIIEAGIDQRVSKLKEEIEIWKGLPGDHEAAINRVQTQINGLTKVLEGFANQAASGKFQISGVTDEEEFNLLVSYYRDILQYSQEIAEVKAKDLQTSKDGTKTEDFRLDILEREVELRYKDYQRIKDIFDLEKARVDLAEKSYRTFWANISAQQKLTAGYYKELERLSGKLGSMYSEQRTAIAMINIDMKSQADSIKTMEKLIASQVDTTKLIGVNWRDMNIHAGMTRKEIETVVSRLGVKGEKMKEIVDLAEHQLSIVSKEADAAKKLLIIKQTISDMDNALTKGYQIRFDMSQKYYNELAQLQQAAGHDEKKIIDTQIAGIERQIQLHRDQQRAISETVSIMQGFSQETAKALAEASSEMMDMDEAALRMQIKWLEIQKSLVDVKKTLEDMAEITESVAELMSSVIAQATQNMVDNFAEAADLQEQIAEQQKVIADLQEQYAEASDSKQQEEIKEQLAEANKELAIMKERSDELRSVWYNIKEIGKEFATGLADIVVEINQEQLKRALQEIITGSSFEGTLAQTLSGGLVQGSSRGSMMYYESILRAALESSDQFYWSIVRAVQDSAVQLRESITQGHVAGTSSAQSGEQTDDTAGRGAEYRQQEQMHESNTALIVSTDKLSNINRQLITSISSLTAAVNKQTVVAAKEIDTQMDVSDDTEGLVEGMSATQRALIAVANQLSTMAGTYIGGGGTGASIGASLGTMLGSAAFGPIGGAVGGIAGGLFGGLFDSDDDVSGGAPVSKASMLAMEENTSAIESNTVTLNKLSVAMDDIRQEMINAPSRFTLPAQAHGGAFGGGGLSVSIQVQGSLTPGVARQVTNDINDIYNNQYRRQGDTARLT